MDFTKSHFYNMKSKKKLFQCLYINETDLHNITNKYKVYISSKEGKGRLVEQPLGDLKRVQKRIKQLLDKNIPDSLPEYILCKKNSGWIDVSKQHINSKTIIGLDISKFFPSIDKISIVKMFTKHFRTSTIVAEILADILTIDYTSIHMNNEVKDWYENINSGRKHKLPQKHLATGSSASVIIAELVSYDMFQQINDLCLRKELVFTTYMDDLHISSFSKVSKIYVKKIVNIIKSYGYEINQEKVKVYLPNRDAVITGVVKKGGRKKLTIKHIMEDKVKELIDSPYSQENNNKLRSYLYIIKLIDMDKYRYYEKVINNRL